MRLRNEVCGAEKQDGTACEDISVSILTHMRPLHRRYSLIYHVDKVISSMEINRPVFLATPMNAKRTHKQSGQRGKEAEITHGGHYMDVLSPNLI